MQTSNRASHHHHHHHRQELKQTAMATAAATEVVDMMQTDQDIPTATTTTTAAAAAEDNSTFPQDDTFPQTDDDDQDAIRWRDVPKHTWLRIIHTREVIVEGHPIKIITLRRQDRRTYTTWSTEIISKAIDRHLIEHEEEQDREGKKLYIKSLGKTASKSNPTWTYYNFKLKLH